MKIEVASCTVKSIHGASSLTVDGTSYEANSKGELEIAQEHLPQAMSHGFALVDGADHAGKVEIKAVGHDPDKSPQANAAAQAVDAEEDDNTEDDDVDYSKLNKTDLLALAEKREVRVETDANKAAIIKALETNDHLLAGEYGDVLKEDLIEYAANRKIEVDAKATKDDIIAALVNADKE